MLEKELAGAFVEPDGFPKFCSFCGLESQEYFLTLWEHINLCELCTVEASRYFAQVCRSHPWVTKEHRPDAPYVTPADRPQATSP